MKFKLTSNTKTYFSTKLFQIEATMDFGNVKKGELGGWIEKETNLSHNGDARVSGNAQVSGNARVSGDARVSGKIKLNTGRCFARKEKDWNVSEIENEGTILMIKDYKPVIEEKEEDEDIDEMTLADVCKELGRNIKIVKE